MSIIHILNETGKSCGDVLSMKYFMQCWRKESICFTVWAKLATEGIIFWIFFPALCVCCPHYWELTALCVVPVTSCKAFRCINCEASLKIHRQCRQERQKKNCQWFAQRGERTSDTRKAADRPTSKVSFWFSWCLINDRAPLSCVCREKRREKEQDKIRWRRLSCC